MGLLRGFRNPISKSQTSRVGNSKFEISSLVWWANKRLKTAIISRVSPSHLLGRVVECVHLEEEVVAHRPRPSVLEHSAVALILDAVLPIVQQPLVQLPPARMAKQIMSQTLFGEATTGCCKVKNAMGSCFDEFRPKSYENIII